MVHAVIVNHDDMLAKLSIEPILANDLETSTKEGQQYLNQLLYTKYEGDSLNDIPRCHCNALRGGEFIGIRCTVCRSVCDFDINRELESVLWMRVPDGVRGFINPAVWITMSRTMTNSNCNALEWLVNPSYKMENGKAWSLKVLKMEQAGVRRGLNNFHDNFDVIMDLYFNLFPNRKKPQNEIDLKNYLDQNRSKIFSKHLPMPSKVGFVIEENDTGTYADQVMPLAIDALRMITSIDKTFVPMPLARKEQRVVKCVKKIAMFYSRFVKEILSKKQGVWRKHIFGGRVHFTGRAVINSLSEPHHYTELHIPWSYAVQIFSLHLTNKLLKMGWNPIQIKRHLIQYTLQYDPLLNSLFNELIDESPYRGFPCLFQRNPSLTRASIQRLYITKVKTDVKINSISISVLAIKGPNADFDGDELNMMLINDKVTHDKLSRFAPELSVISLANPYELSGNIAMPAPVTTTLANFLHEPRLRRKRLE